jgi:hypothetical protein
LKKNLNRRVRSSSADHCDKQQLIEKSGDEDEIMSHNSDEERTVKFGGV